MNINDIVLIINTQSKIQQTVIEIYEQEVCEVIVYDAILDYWKLNHANSDVLKKYFNENEDEHWQSINRLFVDFINNNTDENLEPEILYLLNYYFQKFYLED